MHGLTIKVKLTLTRFVPTAAGLTSSLVGEEKGVLGGLLLGLLLGLPTGLEFGAVGMLLLGGLFCMLMLIAAPGRRLSLAASLVISLSLTENR